jgi:hypothetical protein
MFRLALACLAFSVLSALAPAMADSWAPAQIETYASSDGSARLTVTPREIGSQLTYFEELGARENGAVTTPRATARALLELRDARGAWTRVWDRPLLNDVAPVRALVANGGRYVITFDNWHFVGEGLHVVVIYGADGGVIRSMALREIIPEDYIIALPRSVSSIHWGGAHRIEGERLILQIVVPEQRASRGREIYVERSIDLQSGAVGTTNNAAWRSAVLTAQRVVAQRRAEQAAADARFREPVVGPEGTEERDWHSYLREVYFRLDPRSPDGYPRTSVLRAPSRSDYQASEGWLCDGFTDTLTRSAWMIASPSSPENLLRVLGECSARASPARFASSRIYVAVPAEYRERAVAALAPTGAQVIYVDPSQPIPQRPERLARRGL